MENKIEQARNFVGICRVHKHKKKILLQIVILFLIMSAYSLTVVTLSESGIVKIMDTTVFMFDILFYMGISTVFLVPLLDYSHEKIEIEERSKLFDIISEDEVEEVINHADANLRDGEKNYIRNAYELNRMFDSIN